MTKKDVVAGVGWRKPTFEDIPLPTWMKPAKTKKRRQNLKKKKKQIIQ